MAERYRSTPCWSTPFADFFRWLDLTKQITNMGDLSGSDGPPFMGRHHAFMG